MKRYSTELDFFLRDFCKKETHKSRLKGLPEIRYSVMREADFPNISETTESRVILHTVKAS